MGGLEILNLDKLCSYDSGRSWNIFYIIIQYCGSTEIINKMSSSILYIYILVFSQTEPRYLEQNFISFNWNFDFLNNCRAKKKINIKST